MISQAQLGRQCLAPDIDSLIALLAQAGIAAEEQSAIHGPAKVVAITAEYWGKAARVAAENRIRWCAVWGEHRPPEIHVFAAVACRNGHLLLHTVVPDRRGNLPSQTPFFPAANRPERYLSDMFGVHCINHPDQRRWIRHQAWQEGQYPLLKTFPRAGTPPAMTPPDCTYPFFQVEGEGVYEIPVGPVHAGIIEPGHFRFQAMGEDILSLEQHLGYVHKGIEKCAEGRDARGLVRLAGRVSGDSTVAHAWAACQACESAAGISLPGRALAIRAILAERERIANHLGDIGACCNDVGFTFGQVQCSRLRELWQRQNSGVFGHRLLMDCIVPGGVTNDLDSRQTELLSAAVDHLRDELRELLPLLYEYPSLQDRLRTTGLLPLNEARNLGVLGYLARASGECWDLRRDAPYAPYDDMVITVPHSSEGDASARLQIRGDEILVSLDILEEILKKLPAGKVSVPFPAISRECSGIGFVEGWRGEILAYVHFNAAGTVARYFPRDPSWLNWPALEAMMKGVIVPDFPLCNKSVNGSYSGHDL